MSEITILAPAKINLCLSVLGKRPDGYHELSMLMQMVSLFDEVRLSRVSSGISVVCDTLSVPSDEGNIAWRAASLLLGRSGQNCGLEVEIRKNIPTAAGLGGGSSDAAAVLAGANALLGTGLSREELASLGSSLGMDVPFFFYGPLAAASGRGEMLEKQPPFPEFPVLLVNPGFETSTAWVYKNLNLRLTKKVSCNNIAGLTVARIAQNLHNDLESVTAAAHPVILQIEEALLSAGALGARMSGSGPTVFGIFETEKGSRTAAEKLSGNGWKLFPVKALTASPLEVYHTNRDSAASRECNAAPNP